MKLCVGLAIGVAGGAAHGQEALPSRAVIEALPKDGGPRFNRLVFESSPYLLAHARNPVDWFPFGEEAFDRARREDKPVFLSIGYSTCHWCHVMEEESFSNAEVAELLNQYFICVKVDREERPDIDQFYMSASVASRKSGGWPQTILMAWDKRPFFLASYLPMRGRPGRLGLLELIEQAQGYWADNRAGLEDLVAEIEGQLHSFTAAAPGASLAREVLDKAYRQFLARYDSEHGGFDSGAKFPATHHLSFLLRYWSRTGEPMALEMVEKTLGAMRSGGLYDHLGGGFHRYTRDVAWDVPHFEKMLYDQALLALTYTEAFQATGKAEYGDVARDVLRFALRELSDENGGFQTAIDADNEMGEGAYYVWTSEEIIAALGEEVGRTFLSVYDLETEGNYADQATGEKTGANVIRLRAPIAELAADLGIQEDELSKVMEEARGRLLKIRVKRPAPKIDRTVLTDWNGMMIAALAKTGEALHEPEFIAAAARTADFVLSKLSTREGELFHCYREGAATVEAMLDDYAYLVWGLLALYEAGFDVAMLEQAIALNETMFDRFWDGDEGGFYLASEASGDLPARLKVWHDRARPSGNSVAAMNSLRIARITSDSALEEKVQRLYRGFSTAVLAAPAAFTQLLLAVDFSVGPTYEVVVAGTMDSKDTQAMLGALRRSFIPNKVLLFRPESVEEPRISEVAPFTKTQRSINGAATAYVCRDYTCKAPTTIIDEMLRALKSPQ